MNIRTDYLGYSQCEAIKGFFILMVFVSHFMQYVAQAGGNVVNFFIGQLMVAPFLFYSGYGVMESIKAKGAAYVLNMPKHRILTTLLNFDVAVIAFIILDVIIGYPLTIKQVMFSLVCWDSVGNSNWYIFVILCCYAMAYVSALLFKIFVGEVVLVLCIVCMFVLFLVRPYWWYDTILCFPIGMLYSENKVFIEKYVKKFYLSILAVCAIIAFAGIFRCPSLYGFGLNIKAIAFALAIVLVTMRFPVRNGALEWCGKHLFPLYIYQRMPMILLFAVDPTGFANWRMPIYLVLSFIVTIAIAKLYPIIAIRMHFHEN